MDEERAKQKYLELTSQEDSSFAVDPDTASKAAIAAKAAVELAAHTEDLPAVVFAVDEAMFKEAVRPPDLPSHVFLCLRTNQDLHIFMPSSARSTQ